MELYTEYTIPKHFQGFLWWLEFKWNSTASSMGVVLSFGATMKQSG